MVHAGFAKQDLEKALTGQGKMLEERIEAICLYMEDAGSGLTAIWLTLDFMDFNLSVVQTIQSAVADRTGIPADHVHVVTTHNHGAGEPDGAGLAPLCAECAARAKENAQPAQMRYVFCNTDRKVSYVRRKYVPELDRKITLYYGASGRDGYNAAPFVESAVRTTREGVLQYVGQADTGRPEDPFDDADAEIFALQFQRPDGMPIGSVLRFAAHVNTNNLPGCFSSDYPWHARRVLEERLGGTALFWNGPCGDISPGVVQKGDGSHIVLGAYLAESAVKALESVPFEEICVLEDGIVPITLPVRPEVQSNQVEITGTMPLELQQRRKYLERERLAEFLPFLREKAAETTGVKEQVTIGLGLLRMNGLTIVGFPGETFSTTARALKDAFPERDLCTVTEHGRTVMYLPPAEDAALGGYESVCMSTAPGAEEILRKQAIGAVGCF